MTVARVLKAKSTKLDFSIWYRSCKRDFIMTLLTRPTVVRSAKKISYNSLSAAIHLLMIQPNLYIRRRTRKLLWRINAIPNKWKACCFYGGYSIAQEDRCQWLPRAPEPHPQRVIHTLRESLPRLTPLLHLHHTAVSVAYYKRICML